MLDHQPNDPIHHFNHQFNSKNCNYESWVQAKFDSKARKPAEKYDLYSNWNNDGIQFRRVDSGKFESGVHSPPLWNNIPPASPGSRLQAIVNGQKELMDMVKQMPESYYELTLKDLVDQTKSRNSQEECLLQGKEEEEADDDDRKDQLAQEKMNSRKLASSNKKFDGKTDSRRINSESMENKGLFLKMVFPFGKMKSKKKKSMLKSSSSSSSSAAKINPKLDAEGCDRTSKYGDKDWLKKMFSSGSDRSRSSSGSHSTRTGRTGSTSSNSSNIRTRRGFWRMTLNALGCK